MFEKVKSIKELSKEINHINSKCIDEEGRHIIKINVSDDTNFLSPYYLNDSPIISSDTASFLEHSIKHLTPATKLHFVFVSNQINDEEKKIYEKAIDNYYHLEFLELTRSKKRKTIYSIIMLMVAIAIFALVLTLNYFNVKQLFLNLIDVAAWVFMWEAVDIYFFQRSTIRISQLKCLDIMTAKISFIDKKEGYENEKN